LQQNTKTLNWNVWTKKNPLQINVRDTKLN